MHYALDGKINIPQGVQGGGPPLGPAAELIDCQGVPHDLPEIVGELMLQAGERIVSLSSGGGGYGDPGTRAPAAVLRDVVEGYVSVARARDAYGVVITGDLDRVETLAVDAEATSPRRTQLSSRPPYPSDATSARRETNFGAPPL